MQWAVFEKNHNLQKKQYEKKEKLSNKLKIIQTTYEYTTPKLKRRIRNEYHLINLKSLCDVWPFLLFKKKLLLI